MDNPTRIEAIVARLPEAERVDIEAWDGEVTFRIRKKNFVFAGTDASGISVKLHAFWLFGFRILVLGYRIHRKPVAPVSP